MVAVLYYVVTVVCFYECMFARFAYLLFCLPDSLYECLFVWLIVSLFAWSSYFYLPVFLFMLFYLFVCLFCFHVCFLVCLFICFICDCLLYFIIIYSVVILFVSCNNICMFVSAAAISVTTYPWLDSILPIIIFPCL